MAVDYRKLLIKYIAHVAGQEGITFLSGRNTPETKGRLWDFTELELAAAREAADAELEDES